MEVVVEAEEETEEVRLRYILRTPNLDWSLALQMQRCNA
jgi:hypothetical protein